MTQDEITKLLWEAIDTAGEKSGNVWTVYDNVVERFAALVAAHEREKQAEQSQLADATLEPLPFCKLCNVKIPHRHISLDTIEYTAPVRTVDLTDDDLRICFKSTNTSEPLAEGWPGLERFARAVIAAYKEKNK